MKFKIKIFPMKIDRKPKMQHKPTGLIFDPDNYHSTNIPATWRLKRRKPKRINKKDSLINQLKGGV